MTATQTWTEQTVELAGRKLRVLRGGSGAPVWVLHHSTGNHGWLDFHEQLARGHAVAAPDMPGYGQSERPEWARDARDLGILMHQALDKLGVESVSLVGLGFGGFIAAEMATMNQKRIRRLVLVGAAGIQPDEGEILDQMLVDYDEYVKAGFADQAAYERVFGAEVEPHVKELWDYSREMTARLSWKPYMFSRRLPPLLREVQIPTLLVWGSEDRIIPPEVGRQYQAALPHARLEIVEGGGHFLDLERPDELARLVGDHIGR